MNHQNTFLAVTCLLMSACSTSAPPIAAQRGPAIINVRTSPNVVRLNRNYMPTSPAEVLAEVKDYNAPVKEVHLKFKNSPVEISMEHLNGTTWRALLTADQLKRLSIGGQVTKYDLSVTARDQDGEITTVADAAHFQIQGPDLMRKF